MDLVQLENKLKEIGSETASVSKPNIFDNANPVSVTRKINSISDEDIQNFSEKVIPSWN